MIHPFSDAAHKEELGMAASLDDADDVPEELLARINVKLT